MDYRNYSGKYYVRLDKGDEVVASLPALCRKEGIALAQVQGIGGCGEVTVGVFDTETKTYREETVTGTLEMISLDGNITEYEDKPFLHAHATFAYHRDGEAKLLSGHLLKAVISLTGEIVLTPADGKIGRKYLDDLGIRVWDFS